MKIPTVFISSTSEDLKPHRQAARDAAVSARFHPEMMEYFLADGRYPPLEACRAKAREADVVVVIVAHRYGWVPDPADPKNVTWLECEEALRGGKEVLAFLAEGDWPVQLEESFRIAEALKSGKATPQLLEEVQGNIARLAEFKQWLNGLGIRATFTHPDDLGRKVEGALREWRERRPEFAAAPAPKCRTSPRAYLAFLREQAAWIDIRGLQVGTGRAYRFPIEELYIPLTTYIGREVESRAVELEEALEYTHLVVVGDPGSGKTTFLRRMAWRWCSLWEDAQAQPPPFPILIRIGDLIEHIRHCRGQANTPALPDSPEWLIDFLHAQSRELNWGLDADFFREQLAAGNCVLLLDGLDEASGKTERECIARLFERATAAYRQCRFVVTTRPLSFSGLAGFVTVQIEPLELAAIERFLDRWCRSLFPESAAAAGRLLEELQDALRARPEIRRMARNPVMLTALAVVHWNERRLPEQRADLYDSILVWLARAREKRPGRESAERCLTLLQQLALAMQNHPKGRQVQVEKGWAAGELGPSGLTFIEQEEVDSGIIVSRGSDVRFWHLTFQEHLAARRIAGMTDSDQHELLLGGDRIYRPEWREVVLLLAGVLIRQGRAKVDGLFAAVLGQVGRSLVDQARCAGLLGAIVRDLHPLDYRAEDPRYKEVLETVLQIFDVAKAASIAFEVRLEAAEALGQAGDPRLTAGLWVDVAGGEYLLGAQEEDRTLPNYDVWANREDGPVRRVTLRPFQMGRYPVTVSEYQRFVEADGYGERRWWSAGGFGEYGEVPDWPEQLLHPNQPVVAVSWFEASAYCAWACVRLPTEAEWEAAARGKQGRIYPWGDEKPDAASARIAPDVGRVTPVGLYPAGATPEGIQDMVGNVEQWVSDWYTEGEVRVLRGRAFLASSRGLRAAIRVGWPPDARISYIGFRVARSLP